MEGRNCWPMQIYCSIFVAIVKKESQVFYNILYRCLKRINFLFKTPTSPFSSGWLIIRECAFSSGICNNVRSVFSNSFTQEGFPEINQTASVNEFSTINGWTIFFGLFRISCPWGSSTGSLTQRFKSSGYYGWVLQTGAIKIRRGTHSCFIFRSTLEIILKRGNAWGGPMFQFCINASVPWL